MIIFCLILAIMNIPLFIAKRLYNAKENNNNYTRPIIRIAILAITLSVMIMLLSVFILSGFKSEISKKVFGFGGHINISKFSYNQSFENDPIENTSELISNIYNLDYVKSIHPFATKAGIIKIDIGIKNLKLLSKVRDIDIQYKLQIKNPSPKTQP